MDDAQAAVDLGREALWLVLKLAFPILAAGLLAGFIVSALQAATQIQDPSLAFLPRLVAVVVAIVVLMPWMLDTLAEYATRMIMEWESW